MASKRPETRGPANGPRGKGGAARLRLAARDGETCDDAGGLFAAAGPRAAAHSAWGDDRDPERGGWDFGDRDDRGPGRGDGGGPDEATELEAELEAVVEYLIAVEGPAAVPAIFDIVTRTVRRRLGRN